MQSDATLYVDRNEAGRSLAQTLLSFKGRRDTTIVAVSEAGVLVAGGMAEILELPVDIFLTREVGVPGYEGVTMGAVARGAYLPDQRVLANSGISLSSFVEAATSEEAKLIALESSYRSGRAPSTLTGSSIILVDEGVTNARDMLTAIAALRRHGVGDIIVALPAAAPEAQEKLAASAARLVCPQTIGPEKSLEGWYADSTEVDDESVRSCLRRAAERLTGEPHSGVILKHPT